MLPSKGGQPVLLMMEADAEPQEATLLQSAKEAMAT
jgi:hypothetical protein